MTAAPQCPEDLSMDVHLEVPEEFARRLASDSKGLARAALEALAAEGVRSGKLSAFQNLSDFPDLTREDIRAALALPLLANGA